MYITKEINHYVCIQHTKYDAVLRIIKLNLYYSNIFFFSKNILLIFKLDYQYFLIYFMKFFSVIKVNLSIYKNIETNE